MADSPTAETILIKIGEEDVEYETELSITEVIFWLDMTKMMILQKIINTD